MQTIDNLNTNQIILINVKCCGKQTRFTFYLTGCLVGHLSLEASVSVLYHIYFFSIDQKK